MLHLRAAGCEVMSSINVLCQLKMSTCSEGLHKTLSSPLQAEEFNEGAKNSISPPIRSPLQANIYSTFTDS